MKSIGFFTSEIRDYCEIKHDFKFHSLFNIKDFIKGVDSNLKYYFEIDRLFFTIDFKNDNSEIVHKHISDCFKNSKEINNDILKHDTFEHIGILTLNEFHKLFKFNEYGYAYNESVLKHKLFLHRYYKEVKVRIDDLSILKDNINVYYFLCSETDYFYIIFEHNGETIYKLSARKKFGPNCSFINIKLLKILGSFYIN